MQKKEKIKKKIGNNTFERFIKGHEQFFTQCCNIPVWSFKCLIFSTQFLLRQLHPLPFIAISSKNQSLSVDSEYGRVMNWRKADELVALILWMQWRKTRSSRLIQIRPVKHCESLMNRCSLFPKNKSILPKLEVNLFRPSLSPSVLWLIIVVCNSINIFSKDVVEISLK